MSYAPLRMMTSNNLTKEDLTEKAAPNEDDRIHFPPSHPIIMGCLLKNAKPNNTAPAVLGLAMTSSV